MGWRHSHTKRLGGKGVETPPRAFPTCTHQALHTHHKSMDSAGSCFRHLPNRSSRQMRLYSEFFCVCGKFLIYTKHLVSDRRAREWGWEPWWDGPASRGRGGCRWRGGGPTRCGRRRPPAPRPPRWPPHNPDGRRGGGYRGSAQSWRQRSQPGGRGRRGIVVSGHRRARELGLVGTQVELEHVPRGPGKGGGGDGVWSREETRARCRGDLCRQKAKKAHGPEPFGSTGKERQGGAWPNNPDRKPDHTYR